jgi:hypothetical protein
MYKVELRGAYLKRKNAYVESVRWAVEALLICEVKVVLVSSLIGTTHRVCGHTLYSVKNR